MIRLHLRRDLRHKSICIFLIINMQVLSSLEVKTEHIPKKTTNPIESIIKARCMRDCDRYHIFLEIQELVVWDSKSGVVVGEDELDVVVVALPEGDFCQGACGVPV